MELRPEAMNSARHPATDPLYGTRHSLAAPLRLALCDQKEERRRASLYHALLHRGGMDPLPGTPHAPPMAAAPPLQRGRMVPEPIPEHTVRGALGRLLRLTFRGGAPVPTGERG